MIFSIGHLDSFKNFFNVGHTSLHLPWKL